MMKQVFPKDIIDLMRDAILSLFWPKKEIIEFFENNNFTKKDLKDIKEYKTRNYSRAEIINIAFSTLGKRTDNGIGQFRSMLKSLINWSYYNPYYFNELKKLNEKEAKTIQNKLREIQEERDKKIKALRENNKEKQSNVLSVDCLNKIRNKFLLLYQAKDSEGNNITNHKRGYLLEGIINEILILEKVQSITSIKLQGEQIDGALKHEGENYLIEAKWQDKNISSDALYHFAYKIEGKMYGRGIFISINGYSKESVDMITKGKSLNMVLFDGADIIQIVEGMSTFKETLEKKVIAAQTQGIIYTDINRMKSKI